MCPRAGDCPFYHDRMAETPEAAETLKLAYCWGEHRVCARFRIAAIGRAVPDDLFPRDHHRVLAANVA